MTSIYSIENFQTRVSHLIAVLLLHSTFGIDSGSQSKLIGKTRFLCRYWSCSFRHLYNDRIQKVVLRLLMHKQTNDPKGSRAYYHFSNGNSSTTTIVFITSHLFPFVRARWFVLWLQKRRNKNSLVPHMHTCLFLLSRRDDEAAAAASAAAITVHIQKKHKLDVLQFSFRSFSSFKSTRK